jgi:hypothetical protein
MRDYYDNSAAKGPEVATAFFENVSIGADREVKFYSTHGLIYYWGEVVMEDGANVYLDDVVLDACGAVIRPVVDTIYGDWNGDCVITNAELADLQNAIAGWPGTHNPLMDVDCDGNLTPATELAAFLKNYGNQPPCGGKSGGGEGGGRSAGGEDDGGTEDSHDSCDDVGGLADWLAEVLSEDELADFVARLAEAADEFAGTPVGEDMAELLFWLQ